MVNNQYIIASFTTSDSNEDILDTATDLRSCMAERLGISEAELSAKLANKDILADVVIFFSSSNTVSVNGEEAQPAIKNKVWLTGNAISVGTIKVGSAATGTVMMEIIR